jgi:hypothetical protein
MTFEADRFDEELEQLLEGEALPAADQVRDPLLRLSLELRDQLAPVSPDPDFRARLKAELLEKYADTMPVVPVAADLAEHTPTPLWGRARRAFVAVAVASAASIGLAVGYVGLHQQTGNHSRVALVSPATPTQPTAAPGPEVTVAPPGSTTAPSRVVIFGTHITAPRLTPHRSHAATVTPGQTDAATATPVQTPRSADAASATPRDTAPPTKVAQVVVPTPPSSATPRDTVVPTSTPPPAGPTAGPENTKFTANTRVATSTSVPATATKSVPVPTNTPQAADSPTARSQPATPPGHTATPVPSDTPVPATLTSVPPSLTPRTNQVTLPTNSPTRVPAHSMATSRPSATAAKPTATRAIATQTRVPATATMVPTHAAPTDTAAVPTATNAARATSQPSETATNVPAAPSTPSPSRPTATAAATSPSGPVVVAQVTTTPPGINHAAAVMPSPSPTVPAANQFPVPSQLNATLGSPLGHTVPLTSGVVLHLPGTTSPADPGQLPVYKPALPDLSALDQLRSYGLIPAPKSISQTKAGTVATVGADNQFYLATYQAKSYGYRLKLARVSPVPASLPQAPAFDAASNARTFLTAHQLVAVDDGMQLDSVTSKADGSKVATFSKYAPDKIVGARAVVTFNSQGVLTALDIQWVNTAVAPMAPGISAAAALDSVTAGHGLVHADSALPDSASTITGTTILYVAVNAPDGIYYEPVYRFSGVTATGSAFQVYVPAIERNYLR